MVLKDKILGNTEFQKTSPYVTGRVRVRSLSYLEIKIDAWKYIQTILMGLGTFWKEKLDN